MPSMASHVAPHRFVDGGHSCVLVETHSLEVGTLDRGKGTEAGMWVSDKEVAARQAQGVGGCLLAWCFGCGGGVERKAFTELLAVRTS